MFIFFPSFFLSCIYWLNVSFFPHLDARILWSRCPSAGDIMYNGPGSVDRVHMMFSRRMVRTSFMLIHICFLSAADVPLLFLHTCSTCCHVVVVVNNMYSSTIVIYMYGGVTLRIKTAGIVQPGCIQDLTTSNGCMREDDLLERICQVGCKRQQKVVCLYKEESLGKKTSLTIWWNYTHSNFL